MGPTPWGDGAPMGSPLMGPHGVGNRFSKPHGVGDFNSNPMGFWWGFLENFLIFWWKIHRNFNNLPKFILKLSWINLWNKIVCSIFFQHAWFNWKNVLFVGLGVSFQLHRALNWIYFTFFISQNGKILLFKVKSCLSQSDLKWTNVIAMWYFINEPSNKS